MYRHILVAVNEHLNSEVAARYALSLAKSTGARFSVCFAAAAGMTAHDLAAAQEAAARLFREAVDSGLDAQSLAETGSPEIEIPRAVRREKVDLAFAATRRKDVTRRFFEGTIARSLSVHIPCSFALVHVTGMGRIHPRKILVPLKARIGRLKEHAAFASAMAQCHDARLYLLHVPKPLSRFFSGRTHLSPDEWSRRMPHDVAEYIRQIEKSGISHEGLMVPGSVGSGIPLEASAQRHDLIIMGASERSMVSSMLYGNPVESVLRSTPCDLIVFRPQHED